MAFCSNCGSQINDGSAFCPNCGFAFQNAEPVNQQPMDNGYAPEYQAPVYDNNGYAQDYNQPADNGYAPEYAQQYDNGFAPEQPPKKDNKKLITIIACAVAAVVVIVLAIVLFGGSSTSGEVNSESPEAAVETYAMGMAEGDVATAYANSLMAVSMDFEEYMEFSAEENGTSLDEMFEMISNMTGEDIGSLSEYLDIAKEKNKENLEAEYGSYDITVDVQKGDKYSNDELEELREEIADRLDDLGFEGVDVDKIEEACYVEAEMTIEGSEDSDTDTQTFTAINYDGEWKVYDLSVGGL